MHRQNLGKVPVPDEFRTLLLEFTVTYLMEQPSDVVDFALDYFSRLKEVKNSLPLVRPSSPDDSYSLDEENMIPEKFNIRRKSVFAEAYNPEEDDDDAVKPQVYPKSDEQRLRLAESVKNILLFRSLDQEQIIEVLDAMFIKDVKEGDYIIRQGDDGDNFYVIQNGIYNAYVLDNNGQEKLIHTYNNNGSFGELALLYNMPRAATIKAGSNGSLWAMDRQTFRRIVLKSAFKKRKMYESLIECVPMLSALQSYESMNLADALIPKTYQDGSCIIKQGDVADGMYFVENGHVKITIIGENGKEVEIKQIQKGEYFGELALVTHKPRAASAYAIGQIKVAFLDVEAFERLLGPCMQIMQRNINDYESQLVKIFGSKNDLSDMR